MRDPASLRQISCPNCGAGLDVLGGGRVTTHVCGYCGAELDALENYRLLRRFAGMPRPETPLKIGAEGRILGQSWRVIGVLGQSESWRGRSWHWVDHLIYSETHGYGWITLESGHLTFSRRWRKAVSPGWISPAQVERAENRPQAWSDGERFTYYETATSRITFAEGEFTWRPRVGDRTVTVSLLGPQTMLAYAETGTEREIERSRWLDPATTWAAFGVSDPPRPRGPHPLMPEGEHGTERFALWTSAAGAVVSLLAAGVLGLSQGQELLAPRSFAPGSLPAEIVLPIAETTRLTELRFDGQLTVNSWAGLEITLSDPEDQPLFQATRELGYYSGTDSDGRWTEDSRGARIRFHPEIAGDYTLEIDLPEAGFGEAASGAPPPPLTVSARTGVASGVPSLLAALGLAVVAGALYLRGELRRRRRWAGSDWEDDD
ncbi:MAG: DUF4178 domain-containing protein [Paenirhodobacter sp.]|uniref:DUF4178 domain-containing protein n=1 Tax=Paenirhodobacter sp. TaxID=1965326 RepID=UPI003D0967A9